MPSRQSFALLALIGAGLAGIFSPAHAQQPDLPGIVGQAGRAVVSIRVYDAAGCQIGIGSGFIVQDGRVVTNSHVLEGAARAEIFDSEGQLLGKFR